ncbi:MAG: CoA transferase [Gordonia sp. (in: high G+C Gram-positive bacteria)]|uniref:CaiB/BaiF CoA transferase family protein n=1 Tax=Gordonia sp. (in: high G+C Gram-positive bacteria) TaxID=84139 RepID=UPI0039E2A478
MSTHADLPLAGVVVVELGDSASAPFAGKILAEFGAEVWKIERPTGDSSRGWGPSEWQGDGAAFHALNRGKKLIRLDIKQKADLDTLYEMIQKRADVFLHNLRPGSAGGYGLDAESLRVLKPELIYAEVGAFGNVGPLAAEPGYDPLMQAFSGIMSITGERDGSPVRAGVSIVDFGTGMWSALGILAALHRRDVTQIGSTVSASLLETAIAWMSVGVAGYGADGNPGERHGSGIAFIVPHRAFRVADGDLIVSCANDALYAKLCEALGRSEWAADERFVTNQDRLRHRGELEELIGSVMIEHPRAYWQQRFSEFGVANAPIQTTDELVAHEQTKALGIIAPAPDDTLPIVGSPVSFDGRRPPAAAGVGEVGRDDDQLDAFLGRVPTSSV